MVRNSVSLFTRFSVPISNGLFKGASDLLQAWSYVTASGLWSPWSLLVVLAAHRSRKVPLVLSTKEQRGFCQVVRFPPQALGVLGAPATLSPGVLPPLQNVLSHHTMPPAQVGRVPVPPSDPHLLSWSEWIPPTPTPQTSIPHPQPPFLIYHLHKADF